MGFLKHLKQGLDAARNPATPEQIEESTNHLTPEQRAACDANMARLAATEAQSQAAWVQAAAGNDEARVLEGPAGQYLYGASVRQLGDPAALQERIAEVGAFQASKEMRAQQKDESKTALRQTLDLDDVEQEEDPVERERVAGAEWAARAEARAPLRAPAAQPAHISRFATRGESQLQDLAAFLGSSGRGVGEPSVLDEEVGLAFLAAAGIGPERCLGLARHCAVAARTTTRSGRSCADWSRFTRTRRVPPATA